MCEQYLLSIESTLFHPAKLDRFWQRLVNKKVSIETRWTKKWGSKRWTVLYCLSFLIGYLDNGVSQHRTTITKGRPTDATTRRCGYINCWERQLLSRRLLEGLYARTELSNSSKEWTARTASRSVRIPPIFSHKLLKEYQIYFKKYNLYIAHRRTYNIKVCTFYFIYYICINFAGN